MIVDEGRKIVFLHNPKAGGTSIRTELLKRLGVPDTYRYQGFFRDPRDGAYHMENMSHLDFQSVARILSPHRLSKYRFFGIVRDPLDRFLSAIREFEVKRHDWYTRFNLPLVDFLWEMLTPESVWLPEFPWFRPQAAFFPSKAYAIEYAHYSLEDPNLESKISRFLFGADGQFELKHLNSMSSRAWYDALPEEDKHKILTMCEYLYSYDYDFCAHLGYLYPRRQPQPLNHASYLWKVRAIQTPKINPILQQPPHDDSTLYEEILTTEPPKCG